MKKGYLPREERKKILFLADDIRTQSGVGTMAREIVINTAHRYNWVNLGAAMKHPDAGKAFDVSLEMNKMAGISDSEVKIIPSNGYGDASILNRILMTEKPDAILHFTDPRYWTWLYKMENEIRQHIPMIFYTIWDDVPYPFYNREYYRSDDMLLCISKQTKNIVENVLRDHPKPDWAVNYVPHGIDESKFFPVSADDAEFKAFKNQTFDGKEYDFVVFWNNRNIRRKNVGDVINSWRLFLDQLPEEKAKKCLLLLHTAPVDQHGTDIPAIINTICDPEKHPVKITNGMVEFKQLNYYYNMADAVYSMTDNEGWGLGLTEGMTAGKMIIAPVQGGMQDQMRFEDENGDWIDFSTEFPTNSCGKYTKCGEWAMPMFPKARSIKGSPATPYIYASQVDVEDAALALLKTYVLGKEEITRRGLLGREWVLSEESGFTAANMGQRFIDNIDTLFENWTPRERYSIAPVGERPNNYNEHSVQETADFKDKVKQVLA